MAAATDTAETETENGNCSHESPGKKSPVYIKLYPADGIKLISDL